MKGLIITMKCEIKSKTDFVKGSTLTIRIPEDDLDKKALYTIQEDKPDFLLPFRYKSIDGEVEFVYQIGVHSKLKYLFSNCPPKEYAELWSGILAPLLGCSDWFMKPYSFVLGAEYLYYDKNTRTVSYIYVPSIRNNSNYNDLKEMAVEISSHVLITDTNLENKVLRAILKDFNPSRFLQMLISCLSETTLSDKPMLEQSNVPNTCYPRPHAPEQPPAPYAAVNAHPPYPVPEPLPDPNWVSQRRTPAATGDITIDIPPDRGNKGKTKPNAKDKKKRAATKKAEKSKKKKNGGVSGMPQAPKHEVNNNPISPPPVNEVHTAPENPTPTTSVPVQDTSAPLCEPAIEQSDITQSISTEIDGARLRYVGYSQLPPCIDVRIDIGEVFTIGRFDAGVGRQQSSFEFERRTKAVSRRHAVIERDASGYGIVDLTSSAGTFLNGAKLPPNAPCKLERGCRVSFGNSGADYVWEEC